MRVAAIQLNPQHDKDLNIKAAVDQVGLAADGGARMVLLPEYVDYMGTTEGAAAVAEAPNGSAHQAFADAARTHQVWLHCGSIRVASSDGRAFNTSLVFAPDGSVAATYRKSHLFDVDIPDGVTYRESDSIAPGDSLVTCAVDEWTMGMSICYDLRFPELYRGLTLAGADLLVVPAAFTFYTGRYHWEALLRARAIESQCYVLAAGQVGTHIADNGAVARTNGQSMLIDPWGAVLSYAPDTDSSSIVYGEIGRSRLEQVRNEVPSLHNRRPAVYAAI
ncbi:MAG: carbon-nitrogen hydrolase family protein [Actinomycetia bacterium]|nr:carbon-nitrogen hydrolase family protein [Actinomycetes bacterium]